MADYYYKTNNNLSYPPDLSDTSVHPASIQFKFIETRDATNTTNLQTINLYMPEQVDQPATVNWGQKEFGLAGKMVATAGSQLLQGDYSSIVGTLTKSGADAMGLVAAYGLANIGASAANFLSGGNIQGRDIMALGGNVAPNPYMTALFQSIDLRSFSFKFTFYPFQESDCDVIHNIISSFREHYLPGFTSTDGQETSLLSLPHYCQIKYLWQGQDNKYLPKFNIAAMTYLDVDYTGQGLFAQMRNGFPAEITMMTKWQEIDILTREKIKEGY